MIHNVERIVASDPVEHSGEFGNYATTTLRIFRESGEVTITLFAPTRDRLRVLSEDMATMREVEGRS